VDGGTQPEAALPGGSLLGWKQTLCTGAKASVPRACCAVFEDQHTSKHQRSMGSSMSAAHQAGTPGAGEPSRGTGHPQPGAVMQFDCGWGGVEVGVGGGGGQFHTHASLTCLQHTGSRLQQRAAAYL
jgi:hypothetical protein